MLELWLAVHAGICRVAGPVHLSISLPHSCALNELACPQRPIDGEYFIVKAGHSRNIFFHFISLLQGHKLSPVSLNSVTGILLPTCRWLQDIDTLPTIKLGDVSCGNLGFQEHYYIFSNKIPSLCPLAETEPTSCH